MDFYKELEKYDFLEVDVELETSNEEIVLLLNMFNSNIKRLSKEQNKSNMVIDELLEIVEEQSANKNQYNIGLADLQMNISKLKIGNVELKNMITEMMDKIEVMYRGICSDLNNANAIEIKRIWESLKEGFPKVGINIIDIEYIPYNPQIHSIIETRTDENNPNYSVLEVLKCGYVYADGDVKKAKVIVNKLDVNVEV